MLKCLSSFAEVYVRIRYTLCPNWSEAKIQICINTTYLNRSIYHFNHTNCNLFNANCKSFNKLYSLVAEIKKFKNLNLKTSVSNMWTPIAYWNSDELETGAVFISKHAWLHFTIHVAPSSPDLKPVDYEFWGVLQWRLCRTYPATHQDTRRRPSEAAASRTCITSVWPLLTITVWLSLYHYRHFSQDIIDRAMRQWHVRLRACVREDDSHFDYKL